MDNVTISDNVRIVLKFLSGVEFKDVSPTEKIAILRSSASIIENNLNAEMFGTILYKTINNI